MRPELFGDPEYKGDIQAALNGYFSVNWTTTRTRGMKWDALKIVIRGESLGKSYGIRKKVDRELPQQEDILAALQRQVDSVNASGSVCCMVHRRIGAIWNRLDSYVHKDFRQRLYRKGDCSGHMLAWLLRRKHPIPIILSLSGLSG
ncbi:hypothetical protein NDU88_005143 [Pleurodeles waltl]|uniref:Uncharacterized protein n=1 Tax=Pleurodeles waltl TaxID=8319 RepID=A0AAV7NLV6_PLEWA|nr:hypothetical protein NDU88_005143 [Pleurodeles waltl]